MPVFEHTIPTGETIYVYYATPSNGSAGAYFNGKRLGIKGELTKLHYDQAIPKLQAKLVQEIEHAGIEFDAVVCPPSGGGRTSNPIDGRF